MQTTHQTIRQTVTMILQGFNAGQVTAMQALAQALDLLRQQVLAHGAKAAAAQYHGGTLDELTAAQRQLAALLPWLNS